MFDLYGKKALVTGSTQGIGFAAAKCLAEHGAKVFVHGATSMEKCINAANKIKNAVPVCEDLSAEGCIDRLYDKTGDVDILVLNASIQIRKKWNEITSDEFDIQMKTNFKSSFEAVQRYTGYMKNNNWGRIVTVGSVQQCRPHKDMAVYAASKCAQVSMVSNLAKQLAPSGITVNNVAPGVIVTPRNDEALKDDDYRKQVLTGIPCGYFGTPDDCTGLILLLCSDEGRYITGENIFADGGMKL